MKINTGKKIIEINDIANYSNILELLQENKLSELSNCGGKGICGKCKIKILEGNAPVSKSDKRHFTQEELKDGYRLACTTPPDENFSILTKFLEQENSNSYSIVTDIKNMSYSKKPRYLLENIKFNDIDWNITHSIEEAIYKKLPHIRGINHKSLKKINHILDNDKHDMNILVLINEGEIIDIFEHKNEGVYAVAIDIGTTTLVFTLINLITGEIKLTHSSLNSQRIYGADVISRIEQASLGKLEVLKSLIDKDINDGINELIQSSGIKKENIYEIAVVANTVMTHILMGLSPKWLGQIPFASTTLNLKKYNIKDIIEGSELDCTFTILPGMSAFVGADILSGLLFLDIVNSDEIIMLLDIGTNGELVIGNKEKVIATATAAGPAFEGGNLSCGTGAIPGAIVDVKYIDKKFTVKTIGDIEPVGICGTGIMSIIAEGINNKWIDETGLLVEEFNDGEIEIFERKEHSTIRVTQKDIREFQLAKAAIRSGIDCILKEYNIDIDKVKKIYMSGGLGNNVNLDNLIDIGLIPREAKEKVILSGNSSVAGAIKYLLYSDAETDFKNIVDKLKNINLATDKNFNNLFMENILFEEK